MDKIYFFSAFDSCICLSIDKTQNIGHLCVYTRLHAMNTRLTNFQNLVCLSWILNYVLATFVLSLFWYYNLLYFVPLQSRWINFEFKISALLFQPWKTGSTAVFLFYRRIRETRQPCCNKCEDCGWKCVRKLVSCYSCLVLRITVLSASASSG